LLALAAMSLLVSCNPFLPNNGRPTRPLPPPAGGPNLENPFASPAPPPSANYNRDQPAANSPAPTAPAPTKYPLARRTDQADRVISPYDPFNVVSIEGYKSGDLVKDPYTLKVFQIP